MGDKVKINIQIGDVKHPLMIDRDEEPLARKAARLLTERYEHYSAKFRAAHLPKDYFMAMAGLEIAMRYIRQDSDSNAENAEASLNSLISELNTFLEN